MPYARRPELYDVEYSHKDYAAEAAMLERLVRERAPSARTLLDVACGTGMHLVHLRERFACEGVDLDEGLLGVARERLPGMPLHQGDMRSFRLGRTFDVVTCLFSAIGFLTDPGELDDAAHTFREHVAPGGLLLVEPWLAPDAWMEGRPHALAAGAPGVALARVTVAGRRGDRISTTEMHYTAATADAVEQWVEHHELYLFTEAEMRAAFEGAGFRAELDPEGPIGRGLWICS
jgi:SAM-dependent methyltransferase